MPTGYTAAIVDGKQTEFKDFAMSCARAFGACITMRDDPTNTEIPDEFKPSSHNATRLAEAKAKLEQIRCMSAEETETAAQADYHMGCLLADEYDAKQAEEDRRLDAMLEKVRGWTPPTGEHVGLKEFMVEQLTISKNGDYRASRPKKMTGREWQESAIEQVMRDIGYHAKAQAEEEARAASRTAWVGALRASLS